MHPRELNWTGWLQGRLPWVWILALPLTSFVNLKKWQPSWITVSTAVQWSSQHPLYGLLCGHNVKWTYTVLSAQLSFGKSCLFRGHIVFQGRSPLCPPLPGKAIKLSFSTSNKKGCLFRVFGGLRRSPWGPHAQREEQKEPEGRCIPVSLPFTLSSSLSHTTFKVSREQFFLSLGIKKKKCKKTRKTSWQ